jgi:hypothetical protein
VNATKPKCGYCGEVSKWGYYNMDGLKICDDCGDFVKSLDLNFTARVKPMVGARSIDKRRKHLAGKPLLLGEVHDPVNDLRMSGARIKRDVIIIIVGVKNEILTIDLVSRIIDSRLPFLQKVGGIFFGYCHKVAVGMKNFLTNAEQRRAGE